MTRGALWDYQATITLFFNGHLSGLEGWVFSGPSFEHGPIYTLVLNLRPPSVPISARLHLCNALGDIRITLFFKCLKGS